MCGGEEVGRGVRVQRGGFSYLDTLLGRVERAVFPDGLVGRFFAGGLDEFVVLFVVV